MDISEIRGLLFAALCFSVPIVAGVIDKRTKAKRKDRGVYAEPIDFEALERSRKEAEECAGTVVREAAAEEVRRAARPAAHTVSPEVTAAPVVRDATVVRSMPVVRDAPATKAAPAAQRPAAGCAVPSAGKAAAATPGKGKQASSRSREDSSVQYPTAEEIKNDRKKLILYSEILKPKFDERW